MTAPRFLSWGFCSGDLRINYAWCIGWTKVQNPKVRIVESLTLLVGGLVMIIIFRDQGQWPHQYVYAFYQTYTCFHLVEPRCKPWKEEPICKFRNGVGGLSLSLTFFFLWICFCIIAIYRTWNNQLGLFYTMPFAICC
jgi:hypothetical protein